MNIRFGSLLAFTSVLALCPAGVLAGGGGPVAPESCVLMTENCGDDGFILASICGDGDHGAPKKVSQLLFGEGVVSAELTSCKEGQVAVVTQSTDLCELPPFNDNVCNVRLVLAAAAVECPDTPSLDCTTFADEQVITRDKADDLKDKLVWKLGDGPALDSYSTFGNPAFATSYALCSYAGDTLVAEAVMNADSMQWKDLKGKGFSYKGRKVDAPRVSKAKLEGGDAGKSSIFVLAKGFALPTEATQLQLANSAGACFQGGGSIE